MIVLVNKATKLSDFFLKLPKEYIAKIKFGIETDTLDTEGKIIAKKDSSDLSMVNIKKVLDSYKGLVKQVPPMYSALKHNGKPLYKIARMGKSVERKTRDVEISEIEIKDFYNDVLTIRICCSSGTYIRTLASDIGKDLGTGAVLYGLKRSKIGGYCLEGSIDLKEILDIERINILIKNNSAIVSIQELLDSNPTIFIRAGDEKAVMNGKRISPGMIDFNRTVINGLNGFYKRTEHDFSNIVLVKDLSGSILAIHSIIEKINFDNIESFEKEFTKSIVIL
jgi:tRNA pseudouridine(55) synthase